MPAYLRVGATILKRLNSLDRLVRSVRQAAANQDPETPGDRITAAICRNAIRMIRRFAGHLIRHRYQ